MVRLCIIFLLAALPLLAQPETGLPGAVGWGASATVGCNRSNIVVHQVTNTNDSGAGSLRQAIADASDTNFDVIVFRTGGTISLNSTLRIQDACGIIAGHTAPGGGIQVRFDADATPSSVRGVWLEDSDWIISNFKIRLGDASEPVDEDDGGAQADALHVRDGQRFYFKNVSIAYGTDEGFSITNAFGDTGYVTMEDSIVAYTLRLHSTGSLIVNFGGANAGKYVSLIRTMWHTNAHRNPQFSGWRAGEFINNYVYNWFSHAGQLRCKNATGDRDAETDLINNYFQRGPWSDSSGIILTDCRESVDSLSAYFTGNIVSDDGTGTTPVGDQTSLLGCYAGASGGDCVDPPTSSWFRAEDITEQPTHPASRLSGSAAKTHVLSNAGAWQQLNADGSISNNRDALDTKLLADAANDTGVSSETQIDDESDITGAGLTGGYPSLAAGTPWTDADGDGMADTWEGIHGVSDFEADPDGDGWTNLEEFLWGTDPNESGGGGPGPPPAVKFEETAEDGECCASNPAWSDDTGVALETGTVLTGAGSFQQTGGTNAVSPTGLACDPCKIEFRVHSVGAFSGSNEFPMDLRDSGSTAIIQLRVDAAGLLDFIDSGSGIGDFDIDPDTTHFIECYYASGAGTDATLSCRVDGGIAQTETDLTATAAIDHIFFDESWNGAGKTIYDDFRMCEGVDIDTDCTVVQGVSAFPKFQVIF